MVESALEQWTGSSVACSRGDRLGSNLGNAREIVKMEVDEARVGIVEKEADAGATGRAAVKFGTLSWWAP